MYMNFIRSASFIAAINATFNTVFIFVMKRLLFVVFFSVTVIKADSLHPNNLPASISPDTFKPVNEESSKLGQLLFYDAILSGNKNIACASCHHPTLGTGDGVSLSLGEGGQYLGPNRVPLKGKNRPEQRIGRNSPALFNLGADEFTVMFHDGRLEQDLSRPSGIRTPLEEEMVQGFDSILSAQSMFPVLSPDEMAGHYSENEIAQAVRMGVITGDNGAWQKIAQRIQAIPEYVDHFKDTVPHIQHAEDIHFTDIANVIADFIASEWQAIDSPFDRFLIHKQALPPLAEKGLAVFYGKGQCVRCHSGVFQTDQSFHSIALPEFGPGKVARFEAQPQDFGRSRVTGNPDDRYKFKTPSLRNVALTAPYGHNGAFSSLTAIIQHHLNPEASLKHYSFDQLILSPLPEQDKKDLDKQRSKAAIPQLLASSELTKIELSTQEVNALEAFLNTLTDSANGQGRLGIPLHVPSGLPVE